jgi:BMFP domain-containing protein YqiC
VDEAQKLDPTVYKGVHVRTFLATAALLGALVPVMLGLTVGGRIDALDRKIDDRLNSLPTRAEIEAIIKAATESDRARLAEFGSEQREVTRRAEAQLAVLETKVAALDARIASIGVDRSRDLPRYFDDIRRGKKGNSGGPEGDEDLLQDYAVRLVLKSKPVGVAEARRFVDRAFARPRGAEASELMDLAKAAQAQNRSVVAE